MHGPRPGTEYQPKNEYQAVRELLGQRFPFATGDDGELADHALLERHDGLRGYMLAVILARGIPEGRHEPVSGRRLYLAPHDPAEYVDFMRAFSSPHEQHPRGHIRIGNAELFDALVEWGIPRDTPENPRPPLWPAAPALRAKCRTPADLRAFDETAAAALDDPRPPSPRPPGSGSHPSCPPTCCPERPSPSRRSPSPGRASATSSPSATSTPKTTSPARQRHPRAA